MVKVTVRIISIIMSARVIVELEIKGQRVWSNSCYSDAYMIRVLQYLTTAQLKMRYPNVTRDKLELDFLVESCIHNTDAEMSFAIDFANKLVSSTTN